jgi:hypothetical protein
MARTTLSNQRPNQSRSTTPNTVMASNPIGETKSRKLLLLEEAIAKGIRTFNEVGTALLKIRDEKLYRGEYKTFEDYCDKKWDIDRSRAYQLIDSAEVVATLKMSTVVDKLPTSERQTRPLALLPPDRRVEAWQEATKKAPKGEQPTSSLVQKIVNRIRAKTSQTKREVKIGEGWTHEELKEDDELLESFTTIAAVYGNEDTKAIREGKIGLERADVVFLAKLAKATKLTVQDLVIGHRWKPKHAVRFVEDKPDLRSTIDDLQCWCLATSDKFFSATVGGFTITVKLNRRLNEMTGSG